MYETAATTTGNDGNSNGDHHSTGRRLASAQLNPIRAIDLVMSRLNDGAQKATGNGSADHRRTNDDIYYEGPVAWKYLVLRWPHRISEPLTLYVILALGWALAYTLFPEQLSPDAVLGRMLLLFGGAQLCGYAVQTVGVPDMLGMIGWGVLWANVGLADFGGYAGLEASLREMALVNIMLLAGLGLDLGALRLLFGMVVRLTVVPTLVEVAAVALLGCWLLDMPWLWGVLCGLVVTAVSPNVVVTILLRLREERLGMNKGIHTLIIAMTSCNDVLAIFLFGVVLSAIFDSGPLSEQLLQGPVGIGIGVVYGGLYGVMLWFMPSNKAQYANGLRFTLMAVGGLMSVWGSKFIGYPSAGALGCITIAFVAGIGWRRRAAKVLATVGSGGLARPGASIEYNDVAVKMDLLWKFLKPISFALIGKEVDFAKLDGTVVAYGTIILIVGSAFRLAFAYVSALGGDLSWKERAYVTISGFPKATVQAALGPIALDLARKLNSSEHIRLANNVLVVSVLAIVLTAPLGAVLMIRLAPVWLQRSGGNESLGCRDEEADDMDGVGGDDCDGRARTAPDASDDETVHV